MRSLFARTRTLIARDASEEGASPGQVILMFALFLTVLVGILGLAVDMGFAYSQRRSMQNAADAGALAGTHVVAQSNPLAPKSAQAAVVEVVNKNAMEGGVIGSINCMYVNDSGAELSNCNGTVHPSATGVRVTVVETHPTFFIRVLPGVSDTVNTSADAMANVKKLGMPHDGPFIPCGFDTRLASNQNQKFDILNSNWTIRPEAVGQTFLVHGSKVEPCYEAGTPQSLINDKFKGLADVDANRDNVAPDEFNYKEGVSAGFIAEDVEGPDGCKANNNEYHNCVAFLPIATKSRVDAPRELFVVAFAPFFLTKTQNGDHHAKLLSDYMVSGRGENGDYGWTPAYDGPITVRLTE